jgi:hypothetical protein
MLIKAHDVERMMFYKQRADAGELSGEDVVEWYRTVLRVREQADYYERALIRHMKYGWGLTWREVAGVLGVGTRQAAFQRWRRLIGPRPGAGTYQLIAKRKRDHDSTLANQ